MDVLRNTETVAELLLATARSGLPSPSKSPIATEEGLVPVVKSTLAAKLLAAILPLVDVLRNTETVFELLFATARSGLPSPSKSLIATETGLYPVVKSTFEEISADVRLAFAGL